MDVIYTDKYKFSIYEDYMEIPGLFKKKQILLKNINNVEYSIFFKTVKIFTKDDKKFSIKVNSKDFALTIKNFLLKEINKDEFISNIRQNIINKDSKLKDAQIYFNKINVNKSVPVMETDLFLKDGERAILEELNSEIKETRSVRSSSGRGASVRIAKGVNVGGYSGTSSSNQEWKVLDYGTLTLTNKRLIYTGDKETRDILLSKVISAKIEKSFLGGKYLEVNLSNRKKSIRFSINGNEYIWSTIFQLLKQGADLLKIEKKIELEI